MFLVVSIGLENKKNEANNARFMVHALQMVPEQNCKAVEFQKFVDIHEKSHIPLAFAVKVYFICRSFSHLLIHYYF